MKPFPQVGPHRPAEPRMFQAIAMGKVRRFFGSGGDDTVWRKQCLEPMRAAAFGSACILADDVPATAENLYGDEPAGCIKDVPAWLPPFPETWIEMSLAAIGDARIAKWEGYYEGSPKRPPFVVSACGGYFRTQNVNDPASTMADHPDAVEDAAGIQAVRFIVEYDIWALVQEIVHGPLISGTIFLDAAGQTIPGIKSLIRHYDRTPEQEARVERRDKALDEKVAEIRSGSMANRCRKEAEDLYQDKMKDVAGMTGSLFALHAGQYLCGFAIGLMHCKNISYPTVEPADLRQNPRLPKTGIRYRILKVRPMGGPKGGSSGAGEPVPIALHMVRGRFRDYRAGNGLFGRHRGLYWFSAHVRGSEKHGTVVKDYRPEPENKDHAH